jgi:hypothetical protein
MRNYQVTPVFMGSDTLSLLTNGQETMPYWAVSYTAMAMGSGVARFGYFTARRTEVIASLRFVTGGTAAGATPTLVEFALYSVDSSGDLTQIGIIASDTTIFATANVSCTRSLTSSATIYEGQLYAIGAWSSPRRPRRSAAGKARTPAR